MFRRRHINGSSGERGARFGFAIVDAVRRPLERFAWALEQRLVWPSGDLLRRAFDIVKWPFERLVWVTERRLVWPLQERASGLSRPSRAAGAVVGIATAVGLLAVISTSGSGPGRVQVAAPARVVVAAAPPPSPAPAPARPALQGVPPSFSAVGNAEATATAGGAPVEADSGATAPNGTAEDTGAAASSAKPVPVGPVAMKVARRFAEAFVFFEVGERQERAKAVFGETATPRLASSLGERPPRLPESAKVPQARVLNLVPGPRRGKAFTVSVSLLRVGVTSELRLEMKKRDGAWLVTDVRG
jgi:hypothetical protein